MGLCSGGLIIGRIFASEIWGAYFQEGLFLGGLITGILRYYYIVVFGMVCQKGVSLSSLIETAC